MEPYHSPGDAVSMGLARKSLLFRPLALAVGQLDDPAFRGVLFRSVAWSMACFAALHLAAIWVVHHLLAFHGWLGWTAVVIGSIGASLLTFWLFLPVAAAIGTMYSDRIASAVERRFYPWLPRANSATILDQISDGVAVGLRVLLLSGAALILALLVPGVGVILGWLIAGYAIGRGLFAAVAMRRMPRIMADSLYQQNRGAILAQGAVLALAAYVPVVNLLIPLIGTAAMVHILDMTSLRLEDS